MCHETFFFVKLRHYDYIISFKSFDPPDMKKYFFSFFRFNINLSTLTLYMYPNIKVA